MYLIDAEELLDQIEILIRSCSNGSTEYSRGMKASLTWMYKTVAAKMWKEKGEMCGDTSHRQLQQRVCSRDA